MVTLLLIWSYILLKFSKKNSSWFYFIFRVIIFLYKKSLKIIAEIKRFLFKKQNNLFDLIDTICDMDINTSKALSIRSGVTPLCKKWNNPKANVD